MKMSYSTKKLAQIYIHKIVRLQAFPISIILDWGTQFTSNFLGSLEYNLGT